MTQNKNLDRDLLNKIEKISFKPIFIMGVPRSGTSILYKILNKTDNFNIITSYKIIEYDNLIYNHINNNEIKAKQELDLFFKNKSQNDRGIDKLQINSDFEEEYGFILAQKHTISKITKKTLNLFEEICKKIQFISNNNKPILLKNPHDFANFIYIKNVFPESKFIFIHRNPLKTLNSQLNAMDTLMKQKSHYMAVLSPWYNNVYNNWLKLKYYRFFYSKDNKIRLLTAINRLYKSTNYYLTNIRSLHKDFDYIDVKYEEICEKPNLSIQKIMNFLDLEIKKENDYDKFIKVRKKPVLEIIEKRKIKILSKMNNYTSYLGYSKSSLGKI